MTQTPTRSDERTDRTTRYDLITVGSVVALVVVAALVGWAMLRAFVPGGPTPYLAWPPLSGRWGPHVGPGTMPAIAVAAIIVLYGRELSTRLRFRTLLPVAYVAAVAWTFFLALIDGWQFGIAGRLTRPAEYLHDVPRVTDIGQFLRHFSDGIVRGPDAWTEHVSGHPPGVTLFFVALDRIGLGGGAIAGMICILLGSSACIAVAVALKALGMAETARKTLPFGVLFPGAVWIGVSADGIFTAVVAWGVAAIAVGAAGRGLFRDLASVCGGLLLGYGSYLSYGLILAGTLPLAVAIITRRIRPLVIGAIAAIAVVAAFTAAGFAWWQGVHLVQIRYYQGVASQRPYWYFVWADLAALAFSTGPAVVAGLRRSVKWRVRGRASRGPLSLVAAAALSILLADLSGLSKAEVERIWLPFAVWLVPACALLPARTSRWWLAAQAVLALAVNHLVVTGW
ncbi:hypothetical protein [Fodinicola acaciae]|uniref:hypothetical protein n=1 Tax=Fodinicola acaciae TaxID=2681555 RepID=UPI0013D7FF09|nr:hypothetical protein [Fodinicola acaciae]